MQRNLKKFKKSQTEPIIEKEVPSISEEFDEKVELELIQSIAENESVSIDEARQILEESKTIPEEQRFKPNLEALPRAMQMIEEYHSRETSRIIPNLVKDYIRNLRNPI